MKKVYKIDTITHIYRSILKCRMIHKLNFQINTDEINITGNMYEL